MRQPAAHPIGGLCPCRDRLGIVSGGPLALPASKPGNSTCPFLGQEGTELDLPPLLCIRSVFNGAGQVSARETHRCSNRPPIWGSIDEHLA